MRALIFALMGKGESVIHNPLFSPDTDKMIEAISAFGAKVKVYKDHLVVEGADGKLQRPKDVIQAGNSGLVLRFIAGIASLVDSYVIITGDESIRERRLIKPLLDTLDAQGVFAKSAPLTGKAPVLIKGPLSPGIMSIEGSDSQPVSSLLITTSFLQGISEISVQNPGEKPWIDLTLEWIAYLGGRIERKDYSHYKVFGGLCYKGFEVTIPGDFSTATYPLAAALITGQSMRVSGLSFNDHQADKHFVEILQKMGALISIEKEGIVLQKTSSFQGIVASIDHCIDTLPLLAVIACFATSSTTITGATMARHKESDRISSIVEELQKMGACIEEKEDGMVIHPCSLKGAHLKSHEDHRIALSLLVAACGAESESVLEGVEVIAKTYTRFIEEFGSLGGVFAEFNFDGDAGSWKNNSWESCESKDGLFVG